LQLKQCVLTTVRASNCFVSCSLTSAAKTTHLEAVLQTKRKEGLQTKRKEKEELHPTLQKTLCYSLRVG
jgi:hypothetical protein